MKSSQKRSSKRTTKRPVAGVDGQAADHAAQAFGDGLDGPGVGFRQHDQEFIAAVPRRQVDIPQHGFTGAGYGLKAPVTEAVAVGVVQFLEFVEVFFY